MASKALASVSCLTSCSSFPLLLFCYPDLCTCSIFLDPYFCSPSSPPYEHSLNVTSSEMLSLTTLLKTVPPLLFSLDCKPRESRAFFCLVSSPVLSAVSGTYSVLNRYLENEWMSEGMNVAVSLRIWVQRTSMWGLRFVWKTKCIGQLKEWFYSGDYKKGYILMRSVSKERKGGWDFMEASRWGWTTLGVLWGWWGRIKAGFIWVTEEQWSWALFGICGSWEVFCI